jgi:hypothetical protein
VTTTDGSTGHRVIPAQGRAYRALSMSQGYRVAREAVVVGLGEPWIHGGHMSGPRCARERTHQGPVALKAALPLQLAYGLDG